MPKLLIMSQLVRNSAIFLFLFLGLKSKIWAQNNVFGLVTNDKSEIIPGALIFWKNSPQIGTTTDSDGHFLLNKIDNQAAKLVIRYVGYEPAEIEVLPLEDSIWIEIKGIANIQEIVVTGSQSGSYVSTIDTRSVEHITSRELKKAPCCNLSESFETTGSVDVTYSNAITGTKEIQMLGLRGLYAQLMVESRPTLGGIAQPFAMEFIPGTWLSGVAISKGASTVMNGFGGITGSINVDLEKPETGPRFFANAFGSQEGRGELNLHFNKKLKKGWSTGLLTHANRTKTTWDHNHDSFLDAPNKQQLNGLGRVFYESEPICFQLNVQALTDERAGGQLSMHHPTGQNLWRFDQKIDRIEAWGKLGFKNFKKEYRQLGNMFGASMHKTTSIFGQNLYVGTQKSVYFQTIYATILGSTNHKLNLAANFQGDNYEESLNFEAQNRLEIVPGAEAEYTFSNPNLRMGIADWTIVAGSRIDFHNQFGVLFTPRLNVKYNFSQNMVARISAGRGYRSPNVIAENIGLLASNRSFSGISGLNLEEAWNFGLNFTRNYKINGRDGSMNFDVFHTNFVHQVVVDFESDYSKINVYNLDGKSFSTSLLATFSQRIAPGLDLKLIGKWNEVKTDYQNRKSQTVPLVANWRGLATLDFEPKSKKWMFNTRVGIVGRQRMPNNSNTPSDFLTNFRKKSPVYAIWSGQITRRFKKEIEVYLGGENLNDLMQHHAIISANEPTSPYFNASNIWGPTMGRTIYGGVRWTIK